MTEVPGCNGREQYQPEVSATLRRSKREMSTTIEEARQLGWGDQAEAFVEWKRKVNREVISISGLGCDDLADYDYASNFGREPREVALEILEENGYPMDLLD